jgi:hypothetical protein
VLREAFDDLDINSARLEVLDVQVADGDDPIARSPAE